MGGVNWSVHNELKQKSEQQKFKINELESVNAELKRQNEERRKEYEAMELKKRQEEEEKKDYNRRVGRYD